MREKTYERCLGFFWNDWGEVRGELGERDLQRGKCFVAFVFLRIFSLVSQKIQI